jgi:Fe-S cluster assembly scaffold protein SufB
MEGISFLTGSTDTMRNPSGSVYGSGARGRAQGVAFANVQIKAL